MDIFILRLTLARYYRGGTAIAELGPYFSASSVLSLLPTTEHGGGVKKGRWHPRPCHQGRQRHHQARPILLSRLGLLPLHSPQQGGGSHHFMLALATLEYLRYKRSDLMYPVVSEIQFWYRRHSIRRYLERLTRRRLAAITLQCWKRRIWLNRWFALQAQQHQKRLRLRLLCRGASAYAVSVRGDRQPPPPPTDKTFNPKVLRHPFRDRGLPVPRRKRARRHNRPRRRVGRRHRPRAPHSGGEPLCMPLCFWATQTAVAPIDPCVGIGRLGLKPYLPPHTAATVI